MVQTYNTPIDRQFKNDGNVAPGWKLFFYTTETSTPRAVYADNDLVTPLSNPVIADENGRFPQIFLDTTGNDYKVILLDESDNTIWSADPVSSNVQNDINAYTARPAQHWGTTENDLPNYKLRPDTPITAYDDKLLFTCQIHITNTDPSTLAIKDFTESGFLDPKNIKKYDNAGVKLDIEDGDLQAGQRYLFTYDGVDFIVLNPSIPYINLLNCTEATTTVKGIARLRVENKRVILSNGTDADHDIDFAAGVYDFDDNTGQIVSQALTKQIDAIWEEGNNKGGLDAATVTPDTLYRCFGIYNPTSETDDYLFSLSKTAPTLPSGYTKKKYIGSLYTDASSNIRPFTQEQNEFFWKDPVLEYSGNAISTDLQVLVPPKTKVILDAQADTNSDLDMQIRSLVLGTAYYSNLKNDWAVGDWSGGYNNRPFSILTDSTSEIRLQVAVGGNIKLHTVGWLDYDI